MMETILDFSIFISIFVFGVTSGLHCLVMCGPFVTIIRAGKDSRGGLILYHLGRGLSYIMLGGLFGFIGKGANSLGELGALQGLSAFLAFLLLALIGLRLFFLGKGISIFKFPGWVQKVILKTKARFSHRELGLVIGFVSGLMPCGVLYPAFAASFATGSVAIGSMVMFAFFLGTMPVLTGFGYLINKVRSKVQGIYVSGFGIVLVLLSISLLLYRVYSHSNPENCAHPI
ncbi:MAG: sulfite exporter TauE/SafE family protein [Leptospira sp.]|nr:sulfite exporter TauE/SafE family protein [Leptospira sp.]